MAISIAQQLHQVIQAEFTFSTQLLDIIMGERDSLIQSDATAISQMTDKKQPLVMQLEQLGKQRAFILQSAGFPTDKEGLNAFIANQGPQEARALGTMLEKLRNVAKKCRDNNQINGGIVNVNRHHLQRALSIFRGKDLNVSAYGPGGEYTSQVVRQPLLGKV
jgi:flagella synthesis protein FlgN